jgi:hypothetical protein
MTYISNTFPTSIQSATDPISTDQVATFDHAGLETYQNDSIEALKTKVGVDGSAVTTSHDYKLGEVITTDKAVGKTATQTLTNKTLTSPTITNASSTGTDSGTETLVNKTLTSPTLTTPTISATGFTNAQHAHTGATTGGQLAEGALLLTDITTNDASITKHGFMQKYPNNTSTYLRGDGTFATISGTSKFGGTGADGALSGTTSIDLGAAQVVVKNYTSISLTGTQALTFTNPHANGTIIILKSQGNVTITSSAAAAIDASGMGAIGATVRGGTSGRGGAGLYIECAGAWNFTGTIKNNGADGTQSTNQNGANAGGGAGSTLILYGTLTANSGTSQTNAGALSAQQTGSFSALGNGSDGTISYGFFNRITGGLGGNTGTTGTSTIFNQTIYSQYSKSIYVTPGSGGGAGGLQGGPIYYNGAAGAGIATSIIAANTEFQ